MSRAIHEAISAWPFQDLSIVKKICGDFEVLGKILDCLTFSLGYSYQEMVSKSLFNFVMKPFINPQTLSQFQLLP